MAAARGYEIVREYSDKLSGTKCKRPGLDALLSDAQRHRFAELFDDAVARYGLADHSEECYGVQPGMSMHALHCSFAYSPLASFRIGMSGSASFQRVRKSL